MAWCYQDPWASCLILHMPGTPWHGTVILGSHLIAEAQSRERSNSQY